MSDWSYVSVMIDLFMQVLSESRVLNLGRTIPLSDPSSSSSLCSSKRPHQSPPQTPLSDSAAKHHSKRADLRADGARLSQPTCDTVVSAPIPRSLDDSADVNNGIKEVQVRSVVFVHRRVHSSAVSERGGLKYFKMEAVGLPLLESLPSRMYARDLYEFIDNRVRPCLKSPISELQRRNNSDHLSDHRATNEAPQMHCLRPVATEDAVGGDIPPFGFVLRVVKRNTDSCSRCHWLSRCEGCLIPYTSTLTNSQDGSEVIDGIIELGELESIAIDWHYIVFHEALEVPPTDRLQVITHQSVEELRQHQNKVLPLSKCLQKFTEEEVLDDMVCPSCKNSDGCLRRSFALWRLPPVLIVQLKRFQYNSYSRRKLSNQVDFPFEGLNLSVFLAPSHELSQHYDSYIQKKKGSPPNQATKNTDSGDEKSSDELQDKSLVMTEGMSATGSVYDLFSTVHHVGAMGGGHYLACVRDDFTSLQSHLLVEKGEDEVSDNLGGADDENDEVPDPKGDQWYCYNDSVVSPINRNEICSPSAYLLFYVRRDACASSVRDFHAQTHSDDDYEIDDEMDIVQEDDKGRRKGSGTRSHSHRDSSRAMNTRGGDRDSASFSSEGADEDNAQCRMS